MEKALIIDVSSVLYKSFYKLMSMSNSKGFPTGGLFGFMNIVLPLLEGKDYVVACFDVERASLNRKTLFSEYKSKRDAAPEPLYHQMRKLEERIGAMGIHALKRAGYEADDMVASAVEFFHKRGIECFVLSNDKDLMQLVPKAHVIQQSGGESRIVKSEEEVKDILGVLPSQVVDLFALKGDASDSIPGVKGIGQKTAEHLINTFGNVDGIYSNIDKITEKVREKLIDSKGILMTSRELAKLSVVEIEEIPRYRGFGSDFSSLLEELEFRSILKRLNLHENNSESIAISEIEEVVLKEESAILYEDERYYLSGDTVISSKRIDFNGQVVDTYNAKELYKKGSFNLGLDLMIGYHLLYPEERHSLSNAIRRTFNVEATGPEARAKYLKELSPYVKKGLEEKGLVKVYEDIERPLIPVLAKMELEGVEVDLDYLKNYQRELSTRIEELSSLIREEAGEDFNISSPKQLSFILFEKLNLPVIRKTKTGYSTDSEVLEQLSGHRIVNYVLEYRKLSKIYNTYILPLQKSGGRIHTTYHQDGTATGRLSSSNPNLQNIPVRGEEGLKVRKAFTSSRGKLLVLDYSQIELRIFASLSKDPELMRAYKEGMDLHHLTAKKLFKREDITKEERDRAKAVNYSLVYGTSAFGLARALRISLSEASEYIKSYFDHYPYVKGFMEQLINSARERGYAETLFGRKRFLPDINSRNKNLRSAAERMAINTVIQGTQADIIKRAMVEIDKFIEDKDIKMIMQVHDELIFEVSDAKYSKEIALLMEKAVELEVPLEVNAYIVSNWSEAK